MQYRSGVLLKGRMLSLIWGLMLLLSTLQRKTTSSSQRQFLMRVLSSKSIANGISILGRFATFALISVPCSYSFTSWWNQLCTGSFAQWHIPFTKCGSFACFNAVPVRCSTCLRVRTESKKGWERTKNLCTGARSVEKFTWKDVGSVEKFTLTWKDGDLSGLMIFLHDIFLCLTIFC